MDKITQALRNILPAEQISEVAKAVEEAIAVRFDQMDTEFNSKLEEAYEQLTAERKAVEEEGVKGYQQAYEIISSLMNRLDEQRSEFEKTLDEEFSVAYDEIEKLKEEKNNVEVGIYDEFNKKLQAMKDVMIDKVDQFLTLQEGELYESAKREVLSNPRVLEQRVAVEKMAEILSDYLSVDQVSGISSAKIEEANRQIKTLEGQLRIVESRNVKLSSQKNKLEEQVRDAHEVITEATRTERKERVNRKGIASGRGKRVINEELISEYASKTNTSNNDEDLTEGHDPLNDLLVLSGLEEIR
jgi:hypothetical protein